MLEKVKPYFGDDYLWCPELDLYIRLALANPTANFRHCPEKLVHRTAADPNRFSLRFPGLAAIDACTVVVRFGDNPSSSSAHLGGRRAGARRRIANAIAGVLLQRDIAQLLRVICHPSVRRWLARDLWGFAYVLGNISARSVRRVFRRRNQ